MTRIEHMRLAREREIFRSTGYAVVSNLIDLAPREKLALHAEPETLEMLGHAWIARQAGIDEKGWIHWDKAKV